MSAGWNMVRCVHEKGSGWLVPRRNDDYGQHGAVVHRIKNTCLQSEELIL